MSVQVRGTSGQVADVTTSGEVKVILPSGVAKAPYTSICGMADEVGNIRIPISASTQGLLGIGHAQIDWEEGFHGNIVTNSKWSLTTATMTGPVTNNAVILNSGNTNVAGTHARISSWRQFRCGRGSDRVIAIRALLPTLEANAVVEIGLFTANGTSAPTAGVFFRYSAVGTLSCVMIPVSGAEIETSSISIPTLNEAHDYTIVIGKNVVYFQIDDVVVGYIPIPVQSPSLVAADTSPISVRLYNANTTTSPQQVHVYRTVGALYGGNYGYDRFFLAALSGDIGTQLQSGASGNNGNWANSATPAAATLSNTSAGYANLGGQFAFNAVAGAETDYALFAYQIPAASVTNPGKNLLIHSISIDTFVQGAAVGTTTVFQWGLGYGSTGVSLATGDSTIAKSPRRVPLGIQSIAATSAIGTIGQNISREFRQPLMASPGEYIHIILKMPQGAATASLQFRGVVSIDATWD